MNSAVVGPCSATGSPPGQMRPSWWAVWFKSSLIFCSFDPFRAYRAHKIIETSNSRLKFYAQSSLSLPPNEFAVTWRKSVRAFRIWIAIFSIKCITLAVVQYAFLTAEDRKQAALVELVSQEFIMTAGAVLGNPMKNLKSLAFYVYIALSMTSVIQLIILPHYFDKISPFDIPEIRFLIDPHQELKRLDLHIKLKIDQLHSSILLFFNQKNQRNPSVWHEIASLNECLSSTEERILEFRPGSYSRGVFEQAQKVLALSILQTVVGIYFWLTVLMIVLVIPMFLENCRPPGCSPPWRGDLQVKLFLFEIYVASVMLLFSYSLVLCISIMVAFGQFKLIECIRINLTHCMKKLNYHAAMEARSSVSSVNTGYGGPSLQRRPPTGRSSEFDCIDKMMLNTLIKLYICTDELDHGFKNINRLVGIQILNNCVGLVATFFVELTRKATTNQVRHLLIFLIWLSVNAAATVCAQLHTQSSKTERKFWSILALNAKRVDDRMMSIGSVDFVTDLWHKMVYASSRKTRENLTFQRIIEANFFIISIYSLISAWR